MLLSSYKYITTLKIMISFHMYYPESCSIKTLCSMIDVALGTSMIYIYSTKYVHGFTVLCIEMEMLPVTGAQTFSFDNFLCSQWLRFCQNDISILVWFVVVSSLVLIEFLWCIYPYSSGRLHWRQCDRKIASVAVKLTHWPLSYVSVI